MERLVVARNLVITVDEKEKVDRPVKLGVPPGLPR